MSDKEYDFIIVGSGFGGSVSALRLAQKGYRVAVIERGKRWTAEDYPKSNWNLPKFLWLPKLFCYGIQAITVLRDAFILHGTGVGGGSLVYANTLLTPPDEVFEEPAWRRLGEWKENLAPHYAEAKRMLGVTSAAHCPGPTDLMLKEIAEEMGRGETWKATDVGVYFGTPNETVDDPFFGGDGPARTGCTLCGGCMTGCRYGAKNTLDKNYLYLAEKRGVDVIPETEVVDVRPHPEGGYEVATRRVTGFIFRKKRTLSSRGIVFAGGVLGTIPLLSRCKLRGSLPALSDELGNMVRTNSEALVGATSRNRDADYSGSVAIASGFYPEPDTHIEMVRYGPGHDAMAPLATLLTGGGPPWPRWLRWLGTIIRHPLDLLRHLFPFGWAKRSGILLFMQVLPNHMRLVLRRRWWWPFSRTIDSAWGGEGSVPKYFPLANEVARRLADKTNGIAQSVLPEVLLGLTSTAHILGGCPMGESASDGVIDRYGRVFGYDDMYVADGSIVPVNLSVNPSLTITALSEWVMSHVPDETSQPSR